MPTGMLAEVVAARRQRQAPLRTASTWCSCPAALAACTLWDLVERHGLSALRVLKDDPSTGHIPVVLLTARATDAEVWEGWESGADHYTTKPCNVEELLHFIAYRGA